ncbi:hypothetical protein [Micromonospora sagamiensis]|uniref:Uncharacterized protein n=1 Tax=Micromonospora sagamiensis TaxID=47875 RepID=A0A562WGC2_9ACTN|nr:hypothetical protein [Micromonospora sagamiensis]TWJ29369.1 hypothetical protein JD81_02879 [Micromonospora sagamiensis]BCL17603.1 hypothetical protein GCM10017556_53420 [Micromonospora sagamiensis]
MAHAEAVTAARNNAAWCDAVCRAHGTTGVRDADAWSVPRRSPPWYPDAVTLRPEATVAALLRRVDAGPGASVKDSFAALDLAPYGFRVLVAGRWIHRPAGDVPAGPPLTPVTTASALAAWADAHGGVALRHPALLADPSVTVLAAYGPAGTVTGGAVVSAGGGAVGVSNVFGTDPAVVWRGVCARFGTGPLVGWETDDDLSPALDVGFRPVGPLRVWLRPGT